MVRITKNLRLWLVKNLLTYDEKFLISMAIHTKIGTLSKCVFYEKTFDAYNVWKDVEDYRQLSTKLFVQ